MKKYLIIGLAALVALGACSKQVSGGAQQEVSFPNHIFKCTPFIFRSLQRAKSFELLTMI